MNRIFLLSPANPSGARARMVMSERASFELAVRLRNQGATLGEVFAFISGLYFRGKIAYSNAFAAPPLGVAGIFVITASRGLMSPATPVGLDDLRAIASVPIEPSDPRYRDPLQRDCLRLSAAIASAAPCEVVLLGSIASSKYMDPLIDIFGSRLMFPAEFVGRGDMSRGGLMLRCAEAGSELNYISALSAVRRGPRPPKLPKRVSIKMPALPRPPPPGLPR